LQAISERLDYLSEQFNVSFVMSVNHEVEDIPEGLRDRIILEAVMS